MMMISGPTYQPGADPDESRRSVGIQSVSKDPRLSQGVQEDTLISRIIQGSPERSRKIYGDSMKFRGIQENCKTFMKIQEDSGPSKGMTLQILETKQPL